MKKFDRRRIEIIDCAAHLFASKGYDATGIAELGSAVGVGRGTLYHYIGSKEDLLSEIHHRANTPLLVLGAQIRDVEESGAVRLRLLSEVFFAVQSRMLDHSLVITTESKRLTGPRRDSYVASQRSYIDIVERILRDGRGDGSLAFDDLFIARMAFVNLHVATLRWLDPDGPLSPGELSSRFCKVLFGGIARAECAAVERAVEGRHDDLVSWRDPSNWGILEVAPDRGRRPTRGGVTPTAPS